MYQLQKGVTLIELILGITIIGVSVTSLIQVYASIQRSSADPMLRQQSIAIAEAYLEEIMLKSFIDPDTGDKCPVAEFNRSNYDNVCDYNGLVDLGARDQTATNDPPPGSPPIAGLENYNVDVSVSTGAGFLGINGIDVFQVDVQVTDPKGNQVILTGIRVNY